MSMRKLKVRRKVYPRCPLDVSFLPQMFPPISAIPRNYVEVNDEKFEEFLNWLNLFGEHTFELTPTKRSIKTTAANDRYGYDIHVAENLGYTFKVKCPQGWAYISTRNTTEQCHSGVKMLGRLLDLIPALKQEVTKDGEEWRLKAKNFYDQDRVAFGKAFIGIPDPSTCNVTYNKVWSLDIHWAFPAALTRIRPYTLPIIEDLFKKRKSASTQEEKDMAKAIGNFAIGAMASKYISRLGLPAYGLAKLRYEVLEEACKRIQRLRYLLEEQGAVILNMRTDSIKFFWADRYPPVLPYEGTELGEFSYEWRNATYRQASTAKYEYVVDGIYHPVISGVTRLDRIKPRTKWVWGDIYQHDASLQRVYRVAVVDGQLKKIERYVDENDPSNRINQEEHYEET